MLDALPGTGPGGWVRLFRRECHSQHWLHPCATGERACRAFAVLDLRGMAAWKSNEDLRRGEVVAGISFLAQRWNWSSSTVESFLRQLEERDVIKRRKRGGRKPQVIIICNYGVYSGPQNSRYAADRGANPEQEENSRTENLDEEENTPAKASALPGESFRGKSRPGELITLEYVCRVCRRLNRGRTAEHEIAGDVFFAKSLSFSALEACYALTSVAVDPPLPCDCDNSCECRVLLNPVFEISDLHIRVRHGRQLVGAVRNSTELHDRLDSLLPKTAAWRPGLHRS